MVGFGFGVSGNQIRVNCVKDRILYQGKSRLAITVQVSWFRVECVHGVQDLGLSPGFTKTGMPQRILELSRLKV